MKLNESFSGEGNAVYRYPQETSGDALHDQLRALEFAVPTETPVLYFEKLGRMGGIVEEFIEAPEKTSPSTQLRISPSGEVLPISTHDQLLGGPTGQVFLGCVFPADSAYRLRIQEDPYLALQFLTGGQLDPATGLFLSPSGHTKYYRATDNLHGEIYRGLLPEDLLEILTVSKLHYSHATESGVLFHLIGALSQFGKVGLTAIANSPAEVDDIYDRTIRVLDREAALGREWAVGAPPGTRL